MDKVTIVSYTDSVCGDVNYFLLRGNFKRFDGFNLDPLLTHEMKQDFEWEILKYKKTLEQCVRKAISITKGDASKIVFIAVDGRYLGQ